MYASPGHTELVKVAESLCSLVDNDSEVSSHISTPIQTLLRLTSNLIQDVSHASKLSSELSSYLSPDNKAWIDRKLKATDEVLQSVSFLLMPIYDDHQKSGSIQFRTRLRFKLDRDRIDDSCTVLTSAQIALISAMPFLNDAEARKRFYEPGIDVESQGASGTSSSQKDRAAAHIGYRRPKVRNSSRSTESQDSDGLSVSNGAILRQSPPSLHLRQSSFDPLFEPELFRPGTAISELTSISSLPGDKDDAISMMSSGHKRQDESDTKAPEDETPASSRSNECVPGTSLREHEDQIQPRSPDLDSGHERPLRQALQIHSVSSPSTPSKTSQRRADLDTETFPALSPPPRPLTDGAINTKLHDEAEGQSTSRPESAGCDDLGESQSPVTIPTEPGIAHEPMTDLVNHRRFSFEASEDGHQTPEAFPLPTLDTQKNASAADVLHSPSQRQTKELSLDHLFLARMYADMMKLDEPASETPPLTKQSSHSSLEQSSEDDGKRIPQSLRAGSGYRLKRKTAQRPLGPRPRSDSAASDTASITSVEANDETKAEPTSQSPRKPGITSAIPIKRPVARPAKVDSPETIFELDAHTRFQQYQSEKIAMSVPYPTRALPISTSEARMDADSSKIVVIDTPDVAGLRSDGSRQAAIEETRISKPRIPLKRPKQRHSTISNII